MPVYETPESYLREAIESVLGQLYPHWELCIADDASTKPHVRTVLEQYCRRDPRIKVITRPVNGHISAASNSALELATGEFVALMDHDDVLAPHALYLVAVSINKHPSADLIYSDEDKLDEAGRRTAPYFKPDWNRELLYAQNLISHLGVYRTSLVRELGGFRRGFEGSQDYDLALRVVAATREPIVHIPHILYHWRVFPGASTFSSTQLAKASDAARRAIAEHLASAGEKATVVPARVYYYHRVIRQPPARWPLVSVIVPTRDRIDLIAPSVLGLLKKTDYPSLELIVADNDSSEPETKAYLAALRRRGARVVSSPGPFNYSRINNAAARAAKGEILLFLNNDTAMIDSSWLKEMVTYAIRPDVGAVGARLLYADGTIQHAGVVLGMGACADHVYRHAQRDELGHACRLQLPQDVSCVTGACMAVSKAAFEAVGGFDEDNLAVTANDVDLCIKIREAGYRIIWTPYAELYHFESKSRGAEDSPEKIARAWREVDYMKARWKEQLASDPFFNPNLSLSSTTPELAFPPRHGKPWQAYKDAAEHRAARAVQGPPPASVPSRSEQLLAPIDRSARIIEIGPSHNPIAPKADGWNTITIDHTTRAGLIEKYTGHKDVDVSRIEEVDFVWTGGPLADLVPEPLHGTFDAFIASHVIEHTTDVVAFLDSAERLLSERGLVILAVPDKRYCFDYFRPLTTTSEILHANATRRSRHTPRIAFDHTAYIVRSDGNGAWGQHPVSKLDFIHTLDDANRAFSTVSEDPSAPYVDLHGWQFTPASFELILLELARLGKTDWQIQRITPAIGCEFHAWLRRGGHAAAAALSQSELNARRMVLLKRSLLETRDQIDYLIAGDPTLSDARLA
jgi:GT2 family glycosyltransferase